MRFLAEKKRVYQSRNSGPMMRKVKIKIFSGTLQHHGRQSMVAIQARKYWRISFSKDQASAGGMLAPAGFWEATLKAQMDTSV